MKALLLAAAAVLAFAGTASAADHYVRGYTKKDGTYVAPHYQTNPNSTTSDNYSTIGNVNPYTGQPGTKPDTRPSYGSTAPSYSTPSYSSPSYGSSYGSRQSGTSSTGSSDNCTALYGC